MIWQAVGEPGSAGQGLRNIRARSGTAGRGQDSEQEACHIENVMENIITRMDLKIYGQYGVCMQPLLRRCKSIDFNQASVQICCGS